MRIGTQSADLVWKPSVRSSVGIEERIVDDVVGHVGDARGVDVADDPDARVHALAQPRLAVGAVGRDEDELVLEPVVRVLGHRIVQEDRPGLGRNELVGLLEDLAQEPVDLDLAGVGVIGLVPLEKVLESTVFERVNLQQGPLGSQKVYHLIASKAVGVSRRHAATA